MSLIMDLTGSEQQELTGLELEKKKTAVFYFVYNRASTNINLSAPYMVRMYMTIRSQIRLTIDVADQKGGSYLPLNQNK